MSNDSSSIEQADLARAVNMTLAVLTKAARTQETARRAIEEASATAEAATSTLRAHLEALTDQLVQALQAALDSGQPADPHREALVRLGAVLEATARQIQEQADAGAGEPCKRLSGLLEGAAQRVRLAANFRACAGPPGENAPLDGAEAPFNVPQKKLFPPGTLFPSSGWIGDLYDATHGRGAKFHWPKWAFDNPDFWETRRAAGATLEPVLRKLMARAGVLPKDEQAALQALESAIAAVWKWAREMMLFDTLYTPEQKWRATMRSTEKQQELADRIDSFLLKGVCPADWNDWKTILKGIRQHLPQRDSPGQDPTTRVLLESLDKVLQRHLKKVGATNGDLEDILEAVLPDDSVSTQHYVADRNKKRNEGCANK